MKQPYIFITSYRIINKISRDKKWKHDSTILAATVTTASNE